MKMLSYTINISAPAAKVSAVMLGEETYRQWTAEFNPSSYYEGGWNKGDKILFIGVDENGKKGGMVAEIAEHIPNRLVSIRHYGILDGENEITEGPAVEGWAGALENYTFSEEGGITTIIVDVDTQDKYVEYFNEAWPKALNRLKEIAENS
ncbi:MAG: SRPBCC domain-containing protein [Chitinophagaceae bacterium]|nr:SRPBCC domain-containing protein [Chitinophagaceae bacterium]MCW5929631.1 SRPBCC domain-containing protein [Chitinophagaceae bacterium]